jgi:hypothetical protein
MNSSHPRSFTWLFPACLAVGIIVAFSLLSHSPPGTRRVQKSTLRSGEGGGSAVTAKAGALDLVGVIKSADGQPVTNASVFIYTAQPRSGPGFL